MDLKSSTYSIATRQKIIAQQYRPQLPAQCRYNSCSKQQSPQTGIQRRSQRIFSQQQQSQSPVSESNKPEAQDADKKPQFGYTKGSVVLLVVGLLVFGVALYNGLKYFGVDEQKAGLYTELIYVCLLTFGWVSTYLFRVGTKNMTYVKQLQMYEDAVIEKRYNEMSETELQNLLKETEDEKEGLEEQLQKSKIKEKEFGKEQ